MSWHARSDGTYPFYIRRLFRIAPMFWLAIPFYIMIQWWSPPRLLGSKGDFVAGHFSNDTVSPWLASGEHQQRRTRWLVDRR